jgi:hypothetical protein
VYETDSTKNVYRIHSGNTLEKGHLKHHEWGRRQDISEQNILWEGRWMELGCPLTVIDCSTVERLFSACRELYRVIEKDGWDLKPL